LSPDTQREDGAQSALDAQSNVPPVHDGLHATERSAPEQQTSPLAQFDGSPHAIAVPEHVPAGTHDAVVADVKQHSWTPPVHASLRQ